jgi:oxygen-independent coproporphyrinogen-3 oxidase
MAGIYIHIPFCKKICSYCDFYRIILPEDYSLFIDALLSEAEMRQKYLADEVVSTIYFGGGTPSVLSLEEIRRILDRLSDLFTIDNDCERTIELNPDDIDPSYLNGIRKLGFNRVSLGIQSWRDKDLILLNRRHNAEQAEKALTDTLNAGFENVTVDLIYGIPGMSSLDWISNLDKTFSFDIKHLSAYHLTIEPETTFGKMKKKGKLSEIDEEESANQFNILIEKAEKAGFMQYEISNFGKEGYFSRHNTSYWKQINYLGLGPSAHSFNNYSRQWNVKNVKNYINSIRNNKSFYEGEELTTKTRFNEYIMTSLRTMWGIDLDFVERVFEKEGYDYIINTAGKFKDYGLMKQENKNLILTTQGKMISDNIISEFMMPGEE